VERASQASTEALWHDLHGRLLAYVTRRVSDPTEAEDIVQDVFVRIHGKLDTLDEGKSVTAWVFRIADNAIVDAYRHRARGKSVSAALKNEVVDGDDGPPPNEARKELASCVAPLLAELPPHYAEAIELTELGGLTQAEAAEVAGISVSGMKSRVQRGRHQLKDALVRCCAVQLDRRQTVIDVERKTAEPTPQPQCGCGDDPSSPC
jgi:RNA polymerase sigma-70 factor (ECF subfamily)